MNLKVKYLISNNIIKRQLLLIKLINDNLDVFSMDLYKGEKKSFYYIKILSKI